MKQRRLISVKCKCAEGAHNIMNDGTSYLPECLINVLFTRDGDRPLVAVNHISCSRPAFYTRGLIDLTTFVDTFLVNGQRPVAGTPLVCGSCKGNIQIGDLHYHYQAPL